MESARVKRSTKPSCYIISHCFSNETRPNFNSMENFMEYYFIARSQNYHLNNIFREIKSESMKKTIIGNLLFQGHPY